MSPVVLPIGAEHVASFRRALDEVARERRYLALLEAPPLEQMAAFVGENISKGVAQFVALAGAEVVGWADIVPAWAHGVAHRGSLGMGVLPQFRGQGIGRQLLQACIAKAWANGLTRIELEVRADNHHAVRLYEGLGFRREGLKRRGLCIEGEHHDTLTMALLRDEQRPDRPACEASAEESSTPQPPNLIEQVVRALALYALAEVQAGQARHVRIGISGNDFWVEDDGRGHAISRDIEGAPYLQLIYQHLGHAFDTGKSTPVQLQGLGMSLINSVCAELKVTVGKPSAELRLSFRGARLLGHEFRECTGSAPGNRISGRVDPHYESRPVDTDAIRDWLRSMAKSQPLLRLDFNGHQLSTGPERRRPA